MGLYVLESCILHSGAPSRYKVNCDVLTADDWRCLAHLAQERLPAFSRVLGVPRGGLPFAKALSRYLSATGPTLLCDDVLTTGASLEHYRTALFGNERYTTGEVIGVVYTARGPVPPWVTALLQLTPVKREATP